MDDADESIFVVASVIDGQVVAIAEEDGEPPAVLIVNYGNTKVMDYVGKKWRVTIK